jgi:hypothetical protein
MARNSTQENTRQIFASVREDLYLAAKARAAELRIPLREFVELALDLTLSGQVVSEAEERKEPSVWDDEYLGMQAEQPVGSPVELTKEEAKRVAMAAFGASPSAAAPSVERPPSAVAPSAEGPPSTAAHSAEEPPLVEGVG